MVGGLVANFPLEQFGATSPKTATRMPHSTNPLQTGSSRQFGSRIMAAWLRPPLPIRALPSLATNGLRQTRRPSCQAPADVAHLSFSLALRAVGLQSSTPPFDLIHQGIFAISRAQALNSLPHIRVSSVIVSIIQRSAVPGPTPTAPCPATPNEVSHNRFQPIQASSQVSLFLRACRKPIRASLISAGFRLRLA